MLHAIEIPSQGGDTAFLNMYMAYETLPEATRERIANLSIKHEGVHSSSGEVRPGTKPPASGDVRDYPGAVHPIVRTHPDTGRKALFLGRRINAYVIGLPVAESEALLDQLWAHACQPRFVWTQRWQLGDMVMWDNRVTMHRRDAFDDSQRRLMHRMVVRGERPH
jgi:taurine dioxygenase